MVASYRHRYALRVASVFTSFHHSHSDVLVLPLFFVIIIAFSALCHIFYCHIFESVVGLQTLFR